MPRRDSDDTCVIALTHPRCILVVEYPPIRAILAAIACRGEVMPPLDSDAVLRAEANAIHRDQAPIPETTSGKALYRALHAHGSTALCLSGGGIRSASFALGVIEALAVHPRPQADRQTPSEATSLLRQFNYLSTVSGGGYIGSWLSAWIARCSYPAEWSKLVGRRDHPDEEPGEISWLRAYSNYLT